MKKSLKEKQLEIQLLTEKIQRISGKKVVFKEESKDEKSNSLTPSNKQIGVAEKYLKKIGIDYKIPNKIPEEGMWSTTTTIDLDVTNLGAVSPIFKSCVLKIYTAFGENKVLYINLRYSYTHNSSGSNGNTPVITVDEAGKLEIKSGWMNIKED